MSSEAARDMKVMVLGVRGIPNVQGGVETHAEQLYQRLAERGCEIEVLVRTPFVPKEQRNFGAIRLRRIWSPRSTGLEALVHSVLGVMYAGIARPDLLHIHAIGPALVTPIARLLGLRVVVTHHGPDYDRDKWGRFARWTLRTGERLGMRYAHARIAISRVIADLIRSRFGCESELIPNGAVPAALQSRTDEIERHGLVRGRYFLQVSRIVPEKRQLDLIEAFAAARPAGWKLALVGGAAADDYSRRVTAAAAAAGVCVVLTGFRSGTALQQLYCHAGVFVLPSSHEGLPIAILEALSYGLPVVASNIPANLEIGLPESNYFPVADVAALAGRLAAFAATPEQPAAREARRRWVADTYDWGRVADQTHALYRRVLGLRSPVLEQPPL
ncbi:MAG: glycosyltransferase family 4 protein [Steroidobacteraceae bacterium]